MLEEIRCHDCGVKEGQIHEYGCDMERCPFCGRQLISCDCKYRELDFKFDPFDEFCGLPQDIYENGLTEELKQKWLAILSEFGRIPYIQYPLICARCGELWPDMFMVPDEEWNKYIEPYQRHKILCRDCYDYIKHVIDANAIEKACHDM